MLMKLEVDGVVVGWANASTDVKDYISMGYVESSEDERQDVIAKKHSKPETNDTIEPQREAVKGKPGRKPKQTLASLGYGNDPNNS